MMTVHTDAGLAASVIVIDIKEMKEADGMTANRRTNQEMTTDSASEWRETESTGAAAADIQGVGQPSSCGPNHVLEDRGRSVRKEELSDLKPVVEVLGVTKRFRNKCAVNNVSFRIGKGEAVALLGPNGAGKTTVISMLLGLLEPSEGQVRLFGLHPKDERVRQSTGAMLQEVSVMDGLKVKELIRLFRSYYPQPMNMERLIGLTGLTAKELESRGDKLSGGQRRRLGFALAMAGDPELVFFDEPTVGLDIAARRAFWEQVSLLKVEGKTVLFTTHYLQEAEDAADRILLFADGEVVAQGTPNQIKEDFAKRSVSFRTGDRELPLRLAKLLADEGLIASPGDITELSGRIQVNAENTDKVLAVLFREHLDVRDIGVEQGRLDDAFVQLVNHHEEALKL
jgi:ABC-2 type transport system ATP-binding protein